VWEDAVFTGGSDSWEGVVFPEFWSGFCWGRLVEESKFCKKWNKEKGSMKKTSKTIKIHGKIM
jgi:hypothetical protein